MPRNNADFQAGLFHGTAEKLSPGDLVIPNGNGRSHWGTPEHAYATDDYAAASYFGRAASQTKNPVSSPTEASQHYVYEVEPLDKSEVVSSPLTGFLRENSDSEEANEFLSKKGFRVVK